MPRPPPAAAAPAFFGDRVNGQMDAAGFSIIIAVRPSSSVSTVGSVQLVDTVA
jgi:hypothetical protein